MLEAEESYQPRGFASVSRVRPSREIPTKLSAWRIFKCDFLTLHSYYINSHYPQKYREAIQREKPISLERELLILSEKSFWALLLPSPIAIPWEEICTQTQPTPCQSVESVLELRKDWGFAKRSWWSLGDAIERIACFEKLEKTRLH